jgi:uncharacterized protein (DUF433 family)
MTDLSQDIEQRGNGYYVTGTRVSLDSVVYAFLRGQSPESIAQSFSPLSLVQVYAAITYYLKNQVAVDAYLAEGAKEFEELRQRARREHPLLHAKLEAAKASLAKIRFLGDWDLNQEDIVTGVLRRETAIDFKTGASAKLAGLLDAQVLELAATERRILVTHDRTSLP